MKQGFKGQINHPATIDAKIIITSRVGFKKRSNIQYD
jgi:hypothetical protein